MTVSDWFILIGAPCYVLMITIVSWRLCTGRPLVGPDRLFVLALFVILAADAVVRAGAVLARVAP